MTSQVSPRDVQGLCRRARHPQTASLRRFVHRDTRCTLPGPVEPRTLGLLYVPASAELSQSVDQAKASEPQSLQLCGLDHFCTYAREGEPPFHFMEAALPPTRGPG